MAEKYNPTNELISEIIHENSGLQRRINENLARIDALRGVSSLPSQQLQELTTAIAPHPWTRPLYVARWEIKNE